MLDCQHCLWRCIRAICPEASPRLSIALSRPVSSQHRLRSARPTIRNVSTSAVETRDPRGGPRENSIIKAVKRSRSGAQQLPEGLDRSKLRRLRLELPWLSGDRKDLLMRTKKLLDQQRPEEALALANMASKDPQNQITIVWNAIIGDLLKRKKVKEAFKTYNDMKKRGQWPDAYTYMALFTGLVQNKEKGMGERAVKLWQSLSSPNSKVEPSILLTNAALKACAASNDMDAVWAIAGAIPDDGAKAADSTTFTTILNSMRFSTQIEPGVAATEAQQSALDTALRQARQIWGDIMKRWVEGKLVVDEVLVCAMGRLLLAGLRTQDWDDVLSLCSQTMNIPRQVPRLSVGDDRVNTQDRPAPFGRTERKADMQPEELGVLQSVQSFSQVQRRGTFVTPTNNTLTLLVQTCQKLFLVRDAEKYWKLLTETFKIVPDNPSYHAYLRLLRQARGTSEALRIVRDEMQHLPPEAKVFRIAMSACVRNKFSSGIMKTATELMDVMQERTKVFDLTTTLMYMNLAQTSPHVQDMLVALNFMTPANTNLWEIAKHPSSPQDQEAMLELSQLVISGFDRVIDGKAVPEHTEDYRRDWSELRKRTSTETYKHPTIDEYKKRKASWTYARMQLLNRRDGSTTKSRMSDEERILDAKKRWMVKRQREHVRDKRGRIERMVWADRKAGAGARNWRPDDLPAFEADLLGVELNEPRTSYHQQAESL